MPPSSFADEKFRLTLYRSGAAELPYLIRTKNSDSRMPRGADMQIAIMGTGNVAQMLARRWSAPGHKITFGSRDPASASALDAPVASVADAVAGHDVVVNATPG